MKRSDLESGAFELRIEKDEAALVIRSDGSHEMAIPRAAQIPERLALCVLIFATLDVDEDFLAEMSERFLPTTKGESHGKQQKQS